MSDDDLTWQDGVEIAAGRYLIYTEAHGGYDSNVLAAIRGLTP